MNKTLLATSLSLVLGTSASHAAFTPLPDGNYTMLITSGCFAFGNCQANGFGALADNTFTEASITVTSLTNTSRAVGSTIGSGIADDGLMGVIEFSLSGNNIMVSSFSQDSYLNTAGGNFYIDAVPVGVSGMGGSIDGSGNMSFDPTGRYATFAAFASSLGDQEWNRDDATDNLGSGLYRTWTTSTSTNRVRGTSLPFTLTGTPLVDAGPGSWTGKLVSAGNVGQALIGFSRVQYSEVYNIQIEESGAGPTPRVDVNIGVQGGLTQECILTQGSNVVFNANLRLVNGGELNTLEWSIDGEPIIQGPELSQELFIPLGSHTVSVVATLVTGISDTDLVNVIVRDTQAPDLLLGFVDLSSGEPVTEITGGGVEVIAVETLATDVCDPIPEISANVVPVAAVQDGDVIKIKGQKGEITVPTTALSLSGTATDASNNSTSKSVNLLIAE